MKHLADRVARLEARLTVKPRFMGLPPSLACPVGADGEVLDPHTIQQLGNSWPLMPVREWRREPEETADAFIDRVLEEAPSGALLVQATT